MTSSSERTYDYIMKAKFEELSEEMYIKVSDGSEIRVLLSKANEKSKNGYTICFIAGWNTVVPGWDAVLLEAMKDFHIIYIETREKGSSRLVKKTKSTPERLASDVQEVFAQLDVDEEKLIVFTSSFGVFVAGSGLADKKFNPFLNIFLGPSWKFNMPTGTRYIMYVLPNILYGISKPIWKWWIRKFKSEDPEQAAKYIRAIDEADVAKWRSAAYGFAFWNYREMYERINSFVVVVGMEKDKMHKSKEAKDISELLKNSTYIDLGTNKNTHSANMAIAIRELVSKYDK